MGFFTLGGHYFYSDFIMWVKIKDRQQIVFLEPHGMEHGKTLDNEKIQLWKQMKELEREEALRDRNISLDSFILSKGSYQSLRDGRETPPSKEEFKDNHVLFLECGRGDALYIFTFGCIAEELHLVNGEDLVAGSCCLDESSTIIPRTGPEDLVKV